MTKTTSFVICASLTLSCLLFSFSFLVMSEIDGTIGNGNHGGVVLDIKDDHPPPNSNFAKEDSDLYFSVPFMQKVMYY